MLLNGVLGKFVGKMNCYGGELWNNVKECSEDVDMFFFKFHAFESFLYEWEK